MVEESENKEQEEQPKEESEDKVTLTAEQYNSMIDALSELADLKAKDKEPASSTSLAEEALREVKDEKIDVEDLEQKDFAEYILNEVSNKIAQPLLVKIEEMRVKDEIRELTRNDANKDFWDYKDAIYEIASRNPALSIEEAYNLAKAKAPRQEAKPKARELLTSLPRKRNIPIGEKGNLPGSSTAESEPETRLEAARRAWKELEGN